MTDVRKTSPRWHFIAVLVVLVLTVLGIPAHGTPACVEENDAIRFGPVTLIHATETGDPILSPGWQLFRGSFFFLDISLDTAVANPRPRDTFSISVPGPFVNHGTRDSQWEVIKPFMVGVTQVGDYNIKASLITHILNNVVRGRTGILRTLWTQLVAGGVTFRTSSTLVINGQNYVL